jgi:hypothetical protein
MRRFIIPALVALLGFAVCAPASGAPRFSPSDPGREVGSGALRAARTATPTGALSTNGLTDVRNLTTGLAFSTIQAAIDDAGTLAGHVLEVQVASHAEGICVVNKAVTIQGPSGGAIITSATNTGTAGDARGWFLVTAPGVTFKDLTFDGSANLIAQALRFLEAGTVSHCNFQHIERLPVEYTGVAVAGYKNLTVTDCAFTDIGRIGVFLFSADVTAGVVSGCTYTGKGPGDWLDYGIELGGGAVATLTNNTVTNCTAIESGWSSAGILITTYWGPGTSGTLTGNLVTGNSYGVGVGYDGTDVSTVTAHSNDFSGNTDLALYTVSSTRMVDASANWWGTNTPAGVFGVLYGTVDYTPWFHNAGDVNPVAPGFQGDYSVLDVDDDSPQTVGVARINEAIGLVSGSTVNVAAGLYDERLTINKPMTLRGATSGVSKRGYLVPPAYAYDTATESVIRPSTDLDRAVVHVAADGVVFDGFVVANEVCAAGSVYRDLVAIDQNLTAPTGVQILNSVLGPNTNTASQDGTKGRCGVTVYGPHTLPVKLVVMHNMIFDSKGNGGGIMIVGPYGPTYHGGTVHANYFAGSVIEDNDILGNHRTGIELAGGVQGGTAWNDHILIRNNLIAGNGWFSLAEKDALKYGHGVMFIRGGSDLLNSDAAGSRFVRLEGNVIRDNEKSGLYIGPKNRDLFGTGNVIQDNGKGTGGYSLWDGVRVDLDELYYLPKPTYTDYGFLASVSFVEGGILGNGALGVRVMQTPTAGPVSATCNWWGDVLGPNVPPANPSPGNGIVGAATYAPWWSTVSGPCDSYGPNNVAPVAPATCVTPTYACVQVPVNFNRTDPTPVRGYSVTLTLSSNLSLCGGGIEQGG